MEYYTFINSVTSITFFLLIVYITRYSNITKDRKYGTPFWIINLLSFVFLAWIEWRFPIWRMSILSLYLVTIISIYYLHFRQRTTTKLDYWKLGWLLFFAFDNLTINSMRYIYTTDKNVSLINKDFTNQIDLIFDFTHLVLLCIISYMIFKTEKNKNALQHAI